MTNWQKNNNTFKQTKDETWWSFEDKKTSSYTEFSEEKKIFFSKYSSIIIKIDLKKFFQTKMNEWLIFNQKTRLMCNENEQKNKK